MKRGFSLIMAIFFVMLIATLGMMSLSLSSKITKQSGDIYLKEQAELYAISATSLAVLEMQATDYSTGCFEGNTYDFGDGFIANVSLFYLDHNMPRCLPKPGDIDSNIKSRNSINKDYMDLEDSNGVVNPGYYNVALIDVIVTNDQGIEPIRFHKRTVQRP